MPELQCLYLCMNNLKCKGKVREVYVLCWSRSPSFSSSFLCVGPSVSCWLPKCLRQPCFCLRLCPLPCPAHISEVRWLLMAGSRQRAHSVATLPGQTRGQGQPVEGGGGGGRGYWVWEKGKGWSCEKQPALPASFDLYLTCVTTTLLCLCLFWTVLPN